MDSKHRSILRGEYRVNEENCLYQSKCDGFMHEMVTVLPKKFKPGDRVKVTVELIKRERKHGQ